jgi:MIP family channel proteins
MSERYDREEEPRRRSGRRRSSDPYADDEVRRRSEPLFDEERHGEGGARVRRSGPRAGGLSGAFDRVAGRFMERGSGRRQRGGGLSRGQMQGLYGSDTSANVMGSAIAELIGTFILVFTGCAVAVAAILQRSTAGPAFYDSLAVALAFGLALAAIVAAIGHISGAHVNPAVTLGLAATNKFSWQYVPIYIGAQLVGAILGAIAVWICYGEAAREAAALAATFPTEGVGDIRALLAEILVTFILVFVIISVATDERAPAGVAPLAVGFALACGVFIAGPITGGSLNPARTLGPMIVAGQFTAVWVYIVGPIIGAVLAAVLYDRFVSQADATG